MYNSTYNIAVFSKFLSFSSFFCFVLRKHLKSIYIENNCGNNLMARRITLFLNTIYGSDDINKGVFIKIKGAHFLSIIFSFTFSSLNSYEESSLRRTFVWGQFVIVVFPSRFIKQHHWRQCFMSTESLCNILAFYSLAHVPQLRH